MCKVAGGCEREETKHVAKQAQSEVGFRLTPPRQGFHRSHHANQIGGSRTQAGTPPLAPSPSLVSSGHARKAQAATHHKLHLLTTRPRTPITPLCPPPPPPPRRQNHRRYHHPETPRTFAQENLRRTAQPPAFVRFAITLHLLQQRVKRHRALGQQVQDAFAQRRRDVEVC